MSTDNNNYNNIINYRTNYNNFLPTAINFAMELEDTIQNNPLPIHCSLVPRDEESSYFVNINYDNPNSIYTGKIIMSIPHNYNNFAIINGYVKMVCVINSHNGYFLEIIVNTLNDMYDVISFCQNLLEYQPNHEANNLRFVRVPNNLLNHWCVTPELRNVNLNPPRTLMIF